MSIHDGKLICVQKEYKKPCVQMSIKRVQILTRAWIHDEHFGILFHFHAKPWLSQTSEIRVPKCLGPLHLDAIRTQWFAVTQFTSSRQGSRRPGGNRAATRAIGQQRGQPLTNQWSTKATERQLKNYFLFLLSLKTIPLKVAQLVAIGGWIFSLFIFLVLIFPP